MFFFKTKICFLSVTSAHFYLSRRFSAPQSTRVSLSLSVRRNKHILSVTQTLSYVHARKHTHIERMFFFFQDTILILREGGFSKKNDLESEKETVSEAQGCIPFLQAGKAGSAHVSRARACARARARTHTHTHTQRERERDK